MKDVLKDELTIAPFGDRGVRIQFSKHISPEVNKVIRSFALMLKKENIPGVIEWVPTYTAITVAYDPWYTSYGELRERLVKLESKLENVELPPAEVVYIPTCYGGEKGPDLENIAKYTGLTEAEVIRLHSETNYLIYMMGFCPGFPYLGGLNPQLATPRLASPRPKVPIGGVAIGGEQTGIYCMETPGGWHIIGRTPLLLYDPQREDPILLKAGDYLKFIPVSEAEYEQIELSVKTGTYEVIKELI